MKLGTFQQMYLLCTQKSAHIIELSLFQKKIVKPHCYLLNGYGNISQKLYYCNIWLYRISTGRRPVDMVFYHHEWGYGIGIPSGDESAQRATRDANPISPRVVVKKTISTQAGDQWISYTHFV